MKFLLIIFISFIIPQNFFPVDNEELNYTQILFKWPQIINAEYYEIRIENNQSVESIYSSNSIIKIITDSFIQWGENYDWYVCGFTGLEEMISCHTTNSFSIKNLPEYFSQIELISLDDEQYTQGYNLLDLLDVGLSVLLDQYGNPFWIIDGRDGYHGNRLSAIQMLNNGNITAMSYGIGYEIHLNGDIVFETPSSGMHHDMKKTQHGTYLGLFGHTEEHPPPQECDNCPDLITWKGGKIIEYDSNGNQIKEWNMFDYVNLNEYDPYRLNTYYATDKFDWLHINAVFYDQINNQVLLSLRNISRVIAFDYDTQNIIWEAGVQDFLDNNHSIYELDISGQHFMNHQFQAVWNLVLTKSKIC